MTITAKKIIQEATEFLGIDTEKKNICLPELSNEIYHSMKTHISRSAIMDFAKSPFTYWAKHLNPERPIKETTPAMQFGSAFHTFILEQNKFYAEYAIKPKPLLLKDVGRERYDAYKIELAFYESTNKKCLSHLEFETLEAMRNTLHANQNAMNLIRDARIENSFFWQDEHTELFLKARPDILHDNMIVDLKTCADASPRAFQNSMVVGGYHIQGAMIRDAVEAIEGRRINNVINICIENKYPYNIGIYIIDECAIDEGQSKYKNILIDLKNAIGYNTWTDFGVQTIGLPKWAL